MSHEQFPGSIISKTAPTVTPPSGGEGGSASGIWTMDQANYYIANGTWPLPIPPRALYSLGGLNTSGQLGDGTTINRSSPQQIGALTTWGVVVSPGQNVVIQRTDGTLWGIGNGGYNVFGLNNSNNYSSPKQIGSSASDWSSSISAGENSVMAIKTNGALYGWGLNSDGQLGLGNTTYSIGTPTQVGALTTWSKVASGNYHTLAIKTDGTLWSWGRNGQGQLGLGNITYYSSPKQVGSLTNWSSVAAGYFFSCAIKTDGTLWAWGFNNYGQLGQNTTTNYSSPKQIGALTTWSKVSCALFTILAIKTDGTLWGIGRNDYGTIGDGTAVNKSSPVQIGALTSWSSVGNNNYSTYAVRTNGALWVWGRNDFGQLGLGNTTYYSSPKQVGAKTTWNRVLVAPNGYLSAFAFSSS